MPASTLLSDTRKHRGQSIKRTHNAQKLSSFLVRFSRLILVSWLTLSLPLQSIAAPLPRLFVIEPFSDGQTQSDQIAKRFSTSFKDYLKKSKRLKLEDGKMKARESKDSGLMEAESLKVASIDQFKEGQFEAARGGFVSSLKGFQKSVASIRDMKSVYQTLYYAAASCMALEYDDDAKDFLRQLAAISPEGDFETQVPAKVKKIYEKERKRLLRKKKGAVKIETTPPGAQVWVNGEERCTSPCEIKELARGKHYIWADKTGVGKAGSVVTVKAGWSSPINYNLAPSKKSASNELIPKELLEQIKGRLSEAKVDGQLKEYLDQIAEDQEVKFALFMYLLSEKRELKLFPFLYDANEKKAVALKEFDFKANFSATRITAMKLVKEVEPLMTTFPEDLLVDGVYKPLLDAINQSQDQEKVAVITPPPPSVVPVPPVTPKLPAPKVEPKIEPKEKPVEVAKNEPVKPLIPKGTQDFKAPSKETNPLLPPPKKVKPEEDKKERSILASPWFWTGVGTVIVAGATTTAILLLDSSSDNQSYQSRVEW